MSSGIPKKIMTPLEPKPILVWKSRKKILDFSPFARMIQVEIIFLYKTEAGIMDINFNSIQYISIQVVSKLMGFQVSVNHQWTSIVETITGSKHKS